MFHAVKQVGVGFGEFLLRSYRDNLPVSLVDIHYCLLVLLVIAGF